MTEGENSGTIQSTEFNQQLEAKLSPGEIALALSRIADGCEDQKVKASYDKNRWQLSSPKSNEELETAIDQVKQALTEVGEDLSPQRLTREFEAECEEANAEFKEIEDELANLPPLQKKITEQRGLELMERVVERILTENPEMTREQILNDFAKVGNMLHEAIHAPKPEGKLIKLPKKE